MPNINDAIYERMSKALGPNPSGFENKINNENVYFTPEQLESQNFSNYGFNYTIGLDNEELRAQRQSTGEKFLNATGKATILAGTTFADGIIGTVVGATNLVGESVNEGTFKGSAYWNNDFTNTMKSWQDWGEKTLPNYYTKAEQDSPWYSQALGLSEGTANFWSDKVLKNLGFAIGAGAAAFVSGQGISSLQGTKDVFNRVARGLAVASEDGKLAASVAYEGGEVLGELAKDAKLLKQKNFRSQVAGNILGAQAESRFEALNASKEFIDTQVNKLIEKGYSKEQAEAVVAQDKQIQLDAAGVGNGTFGLNMALLSATGFAEFSEAITKGFNPNKILTNNIAVDLEKGIAKETGKLTTAQSLARKMGKNFVAEGVAEEMGQAVISGTQKDYYNRKYDDNATNRVNSYLDSFIRNMGEIYGTAKGWEEGFIGGFSGMVGIPGMPGNLVSQIKEAKKENAQTTTAVNKLQEIMQKPEFKNRYNSMIRAESIKNDQKEALDNNDLFDYNNAEHEGFMNDVNTFIDAGKFNDLMEYMGAAQNLSLEDAQKLFNKTITNADGTTSTVNPLANESEENLRKTISTNFSSLKQKAEKIKQIRENIETKFNTLDRNSILSLTNMASTIEDVDTRIDKIKNKLAINAPELTGIINSIINDRPADSKERNNLIDDEVFIDALDEKIKQDPQKYDLYNDAKDLIRLLNRKKDFGEAYLEAVQDPKKFEAYTKTKEREAELTNRAGGAKNKYIYDKYTNKDSKFGFDSSEFDVETYEIIPDNTYDVTYTDRNTGEKKSVRAVKSADSVGKGNVAFLNFIGPDGKVINIHPNNLIKADLVTSKKVNKKLKFQENTPAKLVDKEGNEYSTAQFSDQILASEDPSNRQITKSYTEIRKELINEARIKTLQSIIETNNVAITKLQEEINGFKKIAKENLIYLSRALTNKTQKTTVTIDGVKFKKSVAELEQLVIERRTEINEALEQIKEIEKENLDRKNSKNDDLNKVYDQYNNLAQDEKNLALKIKSIKQEIEKASNRLSFLEDIVDRLKKFIINLFDMRKQLADRYKFASIEINTKTREANELRELIDVKLKELDFLEKLYVKFEKENSTWESTLLELIIIKNKETIAEVATQKTSVTEDNFNEVQDLTTNESEVKEAETARKSFNTLASTTGVHASNPDTFNTLPKLDVERDNISLRVVTKEVAPELFTDPKELDPNNPAIKVVVYKNGVPVNKNLEPIAEDDYENLLTLHLAESKLESNNPDYKDKFHDLENFTEEEIKDKLAAYQEWRDNVIAEVNSSGTPKFIYPKAKSSGVIEYDWNKKRTKDFDTTSSVWDSLLSIFGIDNKAKVDAFKNLTITVPSIDTLNGKKVVPGLPYLIFNNSVIPLITRKLSEQDINTVIDLLKLKELGQTSVYTKVPKGTGKGKWVKSKIKGGKKLDGTLDKNGNLLKWQEGKTKTKVNTRKQNKKQFFKYKSTGRKLGQGLYYLETNEFSGEKINIFSYLQSLLYMGDQLPEKRNIQTEFYYDKNTKEVVFYNFKEGKQSRILATAKAIEDNREALTEFLGSKYHQVSKKELDKNTTYYHITKVNGAIVEYEKYESYKHYLLSAKKSAAERNTNDIPLTTNIKDAENPIKSQYFTFDSDPNEPGLKDVANQVKSKKAAPVQFNSTSKATSNSVNIENIKDKITKKSITTDPNSLALLALKLLTTNYLSQDKDAESTITAIFENAAPNQEPTLEIILKAIDDTEAHYDNNKPSNNAPAPTVVPVVTPTGKVNNAGGGAFRLAKTTPYKNGNFEAAKKWLLERFPNLNVEQVKGLIEQKAFGQALFNAVKLSDAFEEGTEYHEGFHITTLMYLTDKELDELYSEASKLYAKPTVKDLRELQATYPNMSNQELNEAYYEEKLAEDFRKYILTKQKVAPKGLKAIFQKLWNNIKELLGIANHPKISELFDKIDTGYFKEGPTVYNRKNKYKLNSSLPGLTVTEKNMLVEGLLSNIMRKFLGGDAALNIDPSSIRNLGYQGNNLELIARNEKQNLLTILKTEGVNQNIIDLVENNYPEVIKATFKYLEQFGSVITYDEAIDTIDEVERASKNIFDDGGAIKVSNEDSTSLEIKLLIGTLPVIDKALTKGTNVYYETNDLGLLKMSEFGSTFNYLSALLNGLTSYDDMINKIKSVTSLKPELSVLIRRLENKSGDNLDDFLLRQKFTQTFAKTKLEYQQWLIDSDGKVYFTNSTGDSQENRILENWKSEINNLINERGAPVKLENGIPTFNIARINENLISANKIKNLDEKIIAKLKALGINMTLVPGLSTKELNKVNENIEYLIKYGITKSTKVEEFFKDSVARLRTIANYDAAINDGDVSLQHIGPDGETRYSITLNNYLTLIGDTFKNLPEINARQKFFELHPYLDNVNTQNSYFLKEDGLLFKANGDKKSDHKFIMSIIEGARPDDSSAKGETIADMKPVDKLWLSINNILTGNIPFLRASDKSLEFGFNLGKPIFDIVNINEGATREKYMNIFKGYIKDEINRTRLLRKGVGANIQFYNKHALNLYLFKNVLSGVNLDKVFNDKNDGIVDSWIKANEGFIENRLDEWFNSLSQQYLKKLIDNKVLIPKNNSYSNNGISTNLAGVKQSMSEEYVEDLLKTFTVSSLIANIEQTKIFTGDPAMYKNMGDFYKRTSAPVGTKLLAFDDDHINNYLNTDHRRRDRKQSNGLVKCVTSKDVTSISQYIDVYKAKLMSLGKTEAQADAILGPYTNMTENDAQGLITLCEYKEFLLRTGTYWSHEHEVAYQKAIKGIELSQEELAYFQPLKAQHFGPKAQASYGANQIASMTFLKLSLMPLIPSVIKNTNLESLYKEMTKKQVGIHIANSGTKLGVVLEYNGDKFEERPFYNKDGSINTIINEEVTYDLYYKFLGIQVEIAPKVKDKGLYGTQERKHILSNTFDQAKARFMSFFTTEGQQNTTVEELQLEYNNLITQYTKTAFSSLIKRLDAKRNLDGTYTFNNLDNIINILKEEAESRRAPDNLIQSIASLNAKDLESFRNPLDSLPSKNKIENILLALVNNDVIKQKVKGGARIQGSSSGFENSNREYVKEGIVKSTGLKFYREGAYGETLPAQFKIALPKSLMPYMKKIGGLTQLNELLAYAFSEVEVPVEINGEIRMVIDPSQSPRYNPQLVEEYLRQRGIDDKFNPKVFQFIGYRIPTQGLNSIENGEVIEFLSPEAAELIVVPSEIVGKSGSDFDIDKLNVFFHEYTINSNNDLISAKSNTQEGIFNRLIEINKLILSSPENFEELITPNSDEVIKGIANSIRDIKKLDLSKNANSLVEWDYIQDIGKYFLVGKAGVGQMALHNTSHVLSQQVGAVVNSSFVNSNNQVLQTKLYFDEKLDTEYSLSAVYDIQGKNKITDIISQLLNGFVDVAKEPYVFFLNANTSTNDTIAYLLRRRVPIQKIANFMAQPIIDDYLKAQSINESMMMVVQGEDVGKSQLIKSVRELYLKKIKTLGKFNETNLLLNNNDLNQGLVFSINNLPKDTKQALSWLHMQVQVLDNFINYQEQATVLNDIMSISKADTTTPKNLNNLLTKKIMKKRIAKANLFSPELINKYLNNTMLTGFEYAQNETSNLYNSLFLTENKEIKEKLLSVLSLYINTKKSQTDIAEVLDLFKNDLITFLYSTTKIINKNKKKVTLSSLIPELFFDKDYSGAFNADVANTLASHKKSVLYQKNPFFKSIVPLINDLKRTQNNIKFFNKKRTTYQSDLLTESYRELLDKDPVNSLAAKLKHLFMLQGGLQNSPISFVDQIPHEYYSNIVSEAIASYKDNPDILDVFIDQFYRNNYSNGTLVPKAAKKYYEETNNTFVYPNDNSISEYPYLKRWVKEVSQERIKAGFPKGYWALYKGSKGSEETTFSEVSKLGDGFYLKEYYPTLRPSVIAKNNVAEDKFEITKLINNFDSETIKMEETPTVTAETTQPSTSVEREYTPENITTLKPNEVFVFGANTAGGHGGGTAGLAQRGTTTSNYTALPVGTKGKWSEYGIIDKLMQGTEGKSFGIVTKAATISGTSLKIGAKRSVPLSRIEESINALIKTASENPSLKFLVTKFGTNMAGFSEQEMKSLLENKNLPDNIILPKEFEVRTTQSSTSVKPTTTELTNSTTQSLKEAFGMDPEFFEDNGITKEEDFDKLLPKQAKELLKKYCNKK